jgi:peptidoglycan/LPS O-acetylase OafA/YrhL
LIIKPAPLQRQRLESLDILRGLAALSVVVYHYDLGGVLAHNFHVEALRWINWPGYSVAVPIFFVLSGFCIHHGYRDRNFSKGDTRKFLLQRFFRLYPAWLLAVIFSAVVLWLQHKPAEPLLVARHLLLLNGFFDDYRLNTVMWSVSVEACLYLCYPLWIKTSRHLGLPGSFILSLAISVISASVAYLVCPTGPGPLLWFFPIIWAGWACGIMLAEIWATQKSFLMKPMWWLSGIMLALMHWALYNGNAYTGPAMYLYIPMIIILCTWPLSLILLAENRFSPLSGRRSAGFIQRKLVQLGFCSYSVYLLHVPLQSLRLEVNPGLPESALFRGGSYIAGFIALTGASWFSYKWIEQPFISLGRKHTA